MHNLHEEDSVVYSQGFTRRTPHASKSDVFRVASVAPFALAMAAICASSTEIGRPRRRRPAAIGGNAREVMTFCEIAKYIVLEPETLKL
jgi:hypothetical protein